jgi:cobalt-zinc-cadmium resistance protein CzcA
MLNYIIEFSIKNKLLIGLFTFALIGYGIYEVTRLPIDAVPDITNNQVQVITIAPSYGATDIERLVTFPVEQANSNISGIKEIRSFSRFGLSVVTIVFDDATDVYWARQQVAERLQKIQNQIPAQIGVPQLGPISTGLGEIYQYVVRPKKGYEDKYSVTELRTIQDWLVRRQLLGVKGVAEVSSFGGKLKQYEIAVNPQKLQSYNITINEVFAALEQNNQNTGGAYIEKEATVLFIRSEGLITGLEDIENIAVKTLPSGMPLFIRDVAEVKIGYATRYGAICYNDEGEVSGAVVMMLKGANSSQVIKDVKIRVAQIQKMLPEGVVIEPFLDRTKMVNNAMETVEKNLLEGALIVVFVLVLFLGNWRAGLIVASVIPLAMLFAVILMNWFGVSGNLMSLGALDFGLIVDGAVIIVEACIFQLHTSHKEKISQVQMDEVVYSTATRLRNASVFGEMIILIVYLPIFTLEGIEGKMFKPMAQTVAFALAGAFVLSLTYVPMMTATFLSKNINHTPTFSDKVMEKIEKAYQKLLFKVIRFPKIVIGAVSVLFIVAVYVLTTLGGEFIPALEEGDFAIDVRVLKGSNLNTTIASTQKASYLLKSNFPEVEKVVTKIGSGEVPTDPMPMEAADLMVILKDKSEWTSATTFAELGEKMSKVLEDVPGITTGFQYPVQMRFNELMTGARQDVVCKIFGENLDTLAHYAQHLGKIAAQIDGAEDIFVEPVVGLPEILITYNRTTLAQYNLTIDQVNKIVNTAFAGQMAGMVFEGEKRFDLVVRLATDKRKQLEDVQNLLIPTPTSQVPLYQVAKVEIKNGPNQIQREDTKRRIVVGFNVRGRDVESILHELQEKAHQLNLPAGYLLTYGGAFENLNAAKSRLMIAVPVALLLIFILLYFAFHSIKQGLLIYSAIPLSAMGGIFFLALRGMPFSISAGVGFIALFGVAVLNGIVLIAEFNRLKTAGYRHLSKIVVVGATTRLRPVLMTAFVASLGFLPMALSHGAGAEVQRPLATVVIGGLLIATFLTLFLLPILYIVLEKCVFNVPKLDKTFVWLALLIALPFLADAQQSVTLPQAIDIALNNNLTVKTSRLRADYQQKLTQSAVNLPQTSFTSEVGQINSIFIDNRFGVSQTFSLPAVYNTQKQILNQELNVALQNVSLTEFQIKKLLTLLFYRILYLNEKEKLLKRSDSIYTDFLEKSTLRFLKGESNLLEKITAENQQGSVQLQLRQIAQEIQSTKIQWLFLLNTPDDIMPAAQNLKTDLPLPDTTAIEENPSLLIADRQRTLAQKITQLEKARLLPELNLSYFTMTMKGIGADDIVYGTGTRFQSAQISVGVPLFFGAQKARINAAKINQKVAQSNYEQTNQALLSQYQSLFLQYKNSLNAVNYYESNALKNAQIIIQTANKQFFNGEINYLDWVILTNQAISIQSNYLDAVNLFNDTVIQMNYLTQK